MRPQTPTLQTLAMETTKCMPLAPVGAYLVGITPVRVSVDLVWTSTFCEAVDCSCAAGQHADVDTLAFHAV